MTHSEFTCPDGREVSELLAFVEGDLDALSCGSLEKHLMSCRACAGEVASLRRMVLFLTDYPESLHPGEVELYRFVSSGDDPDGRIESHIAWCEDCSEDVRMLEEMLSLKDESSVHRQAMPQSLYRRLGGAHSVREGHPDSLKSLGALLKGLLSRPFRVPVLSLGTAAAVLIVVVVSIPMWLSYRETALPVPAAPPQEAVRTAEIPDPPARQEELSADELSPVPAAVKEEIRDKRMPPPKAPAAAKPPSEETPVLLGEVPTESRVESKSSEKSHQRAARAFRGRVQDPKSSAQEPMPAAPGRGVMKAKQAPASDVMIEGELRRDASAVATGSAGRGPVRIRIVDRHGRTIPWLRFEPPADPADGFRFDDAEEPRHEKRSRLENAPTKAKPQTVPEKDSRETLVLIRVGISKDLYDVTAELFEPGSDRAFKTIEAFGISRNDLKKRIKSIVSSLLRAR